MTQVQIADVLVYASKKAEKNFDVKVGEYTPEVLTSIFTIGLSRILGDTTANAKNAAEATTFINKKLDAWAKGEVRSTRETSADPVEREAMRIAVQAVGASPKFKQWLVDNKLVATKGDGLAKLTALAKAHAAKETTIAEAKRRIEAVDALGDIEI